ncbi:hypothetical protein F4678DRAFT_457464 [Xylaria arbuscula]|nr:hypothetical protein F4678DRAFT_457464 [Xylaria arbuscula]
MASIVFNSRINKSVRALLIDGGAYSFASTAIGADSSRINALKEPIKSQVLNVYESGLRLVWPVLVAVPALGVGVTCIEKHVELRSANTEVTQDSQSVNKSESLEEGLTVVKEDIKATK